MSHGRPDIEAIVHEAATALRDLYGDRLRQVLLYGSYARGEADEESDIDLLVVLTDMRSPFAEIEHMGDVMWASRTAWRGHFGTAGLGRPVRPS
jgi:UTP:GlnB (protein PII) uridylyltransferase